jgi:hypothetical protein
MKNGYGVFRFLFRRAARFIPGQRDKKETLWVDPERKH